MDDLEALARFLGSSRNEAGDSAGTELWNA